MDSLSIRVERWFEHEGVPHFSARYKRKDLLPTAISTLAVVFAFEITALPSLEMTLAGIAGALVAVFAVLFVMVPLLRDLWEPRDDWRDVALGLALRGGALVAAGLLLSRTPIPGIGWRQCVDLALLLALLFATIVLARGRRLESVNRAPLAGMAMIAFLVVELFALEGSMWPSVEQTFGIEAPASVFALPSAVLLLVGSVRTVAPAKPDLVAGPLGVADLALPLMFVTIGVQITMLPRVSASSGLNLMAPLAVVLLVSMLPRAAASRPRLADPGRLRGDAFVTAMLSVVFIASLPLYVAYAIPEGVTTGITAGDALLFNVGCLVAIWFVVSNGLDRIAKWMAGETLRDAPSTIWAFVGSLPFVVILLFFVAITTETWQVATRSSEKQFGALLGVLILLTLAIALWGCLRELVGPCRLETWADVRTALADRGPRGRKLKAIIGEVEQEIADAEGDLPPPNLGWPERANVASVMMLYQVIYCAAIGFFTAALFYAVARLAVSGAMLSDWHVGVPAERLAEWGLDPKAATRFADWPLSNQPWFRVALLLGAFSALAFAAHVTDGDDKRKTFFSGPDREVKRRLAMRMAYLRVSDAA